jgi:hypothetical protein
VAQLLFERFDLLILSVLEIIELSIEMKAEVFFAEFCRQKNEERGGGGAGSPSRDDDWLADGESVWS